MKLKFWEKPRAGKKVSAIGGAADESVRRSASYGGMGERELQLRMELLVDSMLSSRRGVLNAARQLVEFNIVEQERFLRAVESMADQGVELAFYFCEHAPRSLHWIDEEGWQDWLGHILAVFHREGLDSAIAAMQNVEAYVESISAAPSSVSFEAIAGVLENIITGLNGRTLKLTPGDQSYTDTETLYLPEWISTYPRWEDNFRLYKATAIHLWAQTWFGTWRIDTRALTRQYADPQRALRLFHLLETLRLDACIQRELPGVYRNMATLGRLDSVDGLAATWRQAAHALSAPQATAHDSARWLAEVYDHMDEPIAAEYQGLLLPEMAEPVVSRRIAREKQSLGEALTDLEQELQAPGEDNEEAFSVNEVEDDSMPDGYRLELQYEGETVTPPQEIQQLLESIQQDLGEIPQEYLEPAAQGGYSAGEEPVELTHAEAPRVDDDTLLYDEWDHARQKYRKAWCQLRERVVQPRYDDFVSRTLQKHRGLIKHLHRTFEALRAGDKHMKRQPHGDDIDIDAVVETHADVQSGLEASNRLFIKTRKVERNIAVLFMVDMSGSTAGWINDMERESLVLLCESLETLGDRYAIYGFSGQTHQRCELFRIKRFEQAYDDEVKARISGIQPQDYTRMGVAIRHLARMLNQVDARTKLLITLSDGRPDDQDGYRGPYGIEDTRRALIEAKYLGIHPYCITIDEQAMDYLSHMYGAVNFTLVNEIDKLPFRVSDIYRRITM